MRLKLFFICICAWLISCKKDSEIVPPKSTKTIALTQAIKDWGYFKEGSYWIVKDSIHLSTDSIYVASVSTQQQSYSTHDTTFISEEVHIKFVNAPLYPEIVLSSYPNDHIYLPGEYAKGVILFEADSTYTISGGILTNRTISDLELYNTHYNNARLIRFSYPQYAQSAPEWNYRGFIYWMKNVGIIKQWTGVYDLDTEDVLRYHVIQN